MASGLPEAAICVQDIDVQCVLQFTLILAAGCALHRHTSRVIHRLELSFRCRVHSVVDAPRLPAQRCRWTSQRHEPQSTRFVSDCVGNRPWFENVSRVHGRSLRRFFEPGSEDRALLDRHESIEKGTRDECTTRKQKVRSGDRNRFIEPETQGTRTHTPDRSNRQIAS